MSIRSSKSIFHLLSQRSARRWRFIYKKTGYSSSTVQVRLLCFWESRTVHHGSGYAPTGLSGVKVTAVVPSGASTGIYETLELSDGGSDYLGKDVYKLGANGIIDACKPGAIVNGIRLYKAKIEEQQIIL
ncbi:hypothetical protein Bca52824_083974 [Brassica carinata]|uniref:Enolase N-terminal domain-containing protein n=1 Tax=Brassica carinata TaxID=52824 RepID=A0A8X7PN95_BRACI|nr:hypothetical protein Bca52824_083974 [Brassica carinata]